MKRLSVFILLVTTYCCSLTTLAAQAGEVSRPIPAWPLLYHKSEPNYSNTDVLFSLLHHERRNTWEQYSFRPFIFSTEGDQEQEYRKTSFLWPLSIYKRNKDDISFHFFPLYWYRSKPESHYNIVFPVYWDVVGEGYSYKHVWPLYGSNKKGETFTEYSTLYPFFRYGTDTLSGEIDLHVLWPIFNRHKKRDYVSHRLLPLYWYEKGTGQAGGFLFPYYWRKSENFSSKGIVPLWYSSSGADQNTDLVFPVYYNKKTPSEHLRFITPLYINSKTDESSWQTLIPLYVNYQKEDFGVQIGLPLLYRYRSEANYFSSFFPVYYYFEDSEQRSSTSYYFPFYGKYQRGENISRHYFLFPLYANLEDEEIGLKGWDLLWPLVHYESSATSSSLRLLPLYWHTKKTDYELQVSFPLYWSITSGENSYSHFLPFYGVNTKGDWYTKRFVFGPVYMGTENKVTGLKRQDILFPLFSKSETGDRKESWFFPFYYTSKESNDEFTLLSPAFFPPYYINSKKPGRDLFHIWPFYGTLKEGTYSEYSFIWPFIRFGEDRTNGVKTSQVFLYYQKAENDKSLTTLFPLWLHHKTSKTTKDGSLFIHWYEHNERSESTKLSFLWLIPNHMSFMSYQKKPDFLQHGLFPLYNYASNKHDDTLRWSFLWPLFDYNTDGEDVKQTSFLWKVISYEREGKNSSEFRFLWRFIRRSKTPTSSVFEFNPLFYTESEEGKGSYWAILGGLIGVETTPEGKRNTRFFWIF